MRLDQYVAEFWPEKSRSTWKKLIEAGYVRVNDVVEATVKFDLGEDDVVTIDTLPVVDAPVQTLPIVYEDDHIVVINKPAGVLTHAKGVEHEEYTVADFVRSKLSEPDETNRPGIVHRLDRDTSGVLIAAKDAESKRLLQKQFQDRKAKKTYLGVVCGTPKHNEANLDLPIGRNPKKPSTFRVDPNGKPAQTHYEVLGSNDRFSVVRLKPTTGRTHQLRVHMAYLGTPIVGDILYGSSTSPIKRLCLHAEQLEITVPGSKRETFVVPPPDDLQGFIDDIIKP